MPTPIRNALISVFDKTGLDKLAPVLKFHGVRVYSTGGTADYLQNQCGLEVIAVEDVTQFPEMMSGRVKTLHPKIFGGILARRDKDADEASKHQIPLIDLVVVNLYPFGQHLTETQEEQRSWIDIGGPSMLRAASKNSGWVTVLSSPEDYDLFIQDINSNKGANSEALRKMLAVKTFQRTAAYDAMIAAAWGASDLPAFAGPETTLRYGENPHQRACWIGQWNQSWKILQGKELSYNNLLDADAAFRLVLDFKDPSVAIIKHNSPCGVSSSTGPVHEIFQKAFEADSKSAFGGIVALNGTVDAKTAQAMSPIFLEVVIAKGFSEEAKQIFAQKKNLRLIEWPEPDLGQHEIRKSLGGWLVQASDDKLLEGTPKVVTKKEPKNWKDLEFAWTVVKHARSNAIVIAKNLTTVAIGAGQVSRVDAVEIAIRKSAGTQETVLASDAFFPFRDNIDLMKQSGISAIIQPGGSTRDAEVIDACNEQGISMVFTGIRHFRH